MRQAMMGGIVLAIVVSVLVLTAKPTVLDIADVAVLGVAIGAVLGVVTDRTPLARVGGFGAGFGVAWLVYALRAEVLPDSARGVAVASAILLLGAVLLFWLSVYRLPFWSLLLGGIAMVSAYEQSFVAAPSRFGEESPGVATQMLLSAAIGFLVMVLLAPRPPAPAREAGRYRDRSGVIIQPDEESEAEERDHVSLEEMFDDLAERGASR